MLRGVGGFHRAVVVLIVPMILGVVGAPAQAAAPGVGSVRASFGTVMFDMAKGWGAARSCVVFSRTSVRCYASNEQADTALGYSAAADPLVNGLVAGAEAPACASGWLCLYENANGEGRRLQFRDEFWNYLSVYDFDRQASSWRNNQGGSDISYLSLYNRTTVYSCGASSFALTLGGYDNQAYAVWG